MPRIVARSLGKKYKRYRHPLARLVEWASGDRIVCHEAEWALRGVSFEVGDGESLGIIGMNGAGKSTLLRVLTGTTLPSEGSFEVRGRVAALLELGLGVHPEFTGWQNATLAGQLLGLDDETLAAALPWVQEFSELGDHMDQPVRTYSTGMQVRLAFSVATAVRPDVLIVDEALSVGDAYFQHKSMSRIRAFQEQGTTLLFVTHDPAAVKALCRRAILLDRGTLLRDGPPDAVFDYYNAMIARKEDEAEIEQVESEGRIATRSGSREAEIVAVELLDDARVPRRSFAVGETAAIRVRLRTNRDMPSPTVGFLIRDRLGNDVFGSNSFYLGVAHEPCTAGDEVCATFDVVLHVGCGSYSVTVALHTERAHVDASFDWWDRALLFQVVPGRGPGFTGVAALPVRATLSRPARDARDGTAG
ncbi:MAG: ABC transporter ATP-binding protein [Thermodesulfobacteriota bacterium]